MYRGLLFPFILISAVPGLSEMHGDQKNLINVDSWTRRQDQLRETLKILDSTSLRALEELSAIDKLNNSTDQALFAAVPRAKNSIVFHSQRFVDALAATGKSRRLMHLLNVHDNKEDDVFLIYLACLGRMGLSAKEALPLLRKKLEEPDLPPNVKVSVQVVLADIGDPSKEIRRAILRSLEEPGSADDTLMMVIQTWPSPNAWINRDVEKQITNRMIKEAQHKNREYESLLGLTTVLGLLGEKASPALGSLKSLQRAAIEDHDQTAIVLSLALARIDPKNSTIALRSLFKGFSKIFRRFGRGSIALLLEYPYCIVNSEVSIQLAKMLEDPDLEVSEGAASVLIWAGLKSRDAFPIVLEYLQKTEDDKRRALAVRVLRRIGDFSRLGQLDSALNEDTPQRIRSAINAVKLGIKELDDGYAGTFSKYFE
jgi:HEAT repeat protein